VVDVCLITWHQLLDLGHLAGDKISAKDEEKHFGRNSQSHKMRFPLAVRVSHEQLATMLKVQHAVGHQPHRICIIIYCALVKEVDAY